MVLGFLWDPLYPDGNIQAHTQVSVTTMINAHYYHSHRLTYMLVGSAFYYNTLVICFWRKKIPRVGTDLFPWRPWGASRARLSIGTLKRKVSVSTDEMATNLTYSPYILGLFSPDKAKTETNRCAHQTRGSRMSWGSWVTLSIQICGTES